MDYSFLTKTMLFRGTSEDEAKSMLSCLETHEKQYKKGSIIYHSGECIKNMGLVLSGGVNIVINDVWGNETILSHVQAGQLFSEVYACIPNEPLLVNVIASENSSVLFLNASKMLTTCQSVCPHHRRLIMNLLQISAAKNLSLSRHILHTSPKTIRGRLISYLSEQSKRCGSYQFTIPFNRQELADYLGVDRSALSNELSKMQKDDILEFNKNRFTLKVT
ncbi:MAG TPA: Crp/Fnr family transcriptional regulator [Lachnospiraceae bacterium]|nr:Crp/Fnr family transcriptional regulator [Lachnospiraceae bacterium]